MERLVALLMRRVVLVVGAVVLVLGAIPGLALAVPDEETPSDPERSQTAPPATGLCPDGSLCAWPERAFTGDITEIGDADKGGCRELARPARSAINDSGRTAVFYASPGCTGGVVVGIEPGRRASSFADAASVRLRQPGPVPPTAGVESEETPTAEPSVSEPAS